MKDDKAEVWDPLLEMNLGTAKDPRLMFISVLLKEDVKKRLIELLTFYKDYFAWDYDELLGLDMELVEHYLLIKSNFRPYQQPPRCITPEQS